MRPWMSGGTGFRACAGTAWKGCATRIVLLLALAMLLGGCVRASVTSPDIQRPSLAQELADLQAARDGGAITPAEYDQLRGRIAANYDKFAPPRKKTYSYHWP